jgi:hypothetical protein
LRAVRAPPQLNDHPINPLEQACLKRYPHTT